MAQHKVTLIVFLMREIKIFLINNTILNVLFVSLSITVSLDCNCYEQRKSSVHICLYVTLSTKYFVADHNKQLYIVQLTVFSFEKPFN